MIGTHTQVQRLPWWKYFSEFLRNYLRFSDFSIVWEILGDFSDFFRKFSIVSENNKIVNLIFKEKRGKFRFLKNSKKSLPFSADISYFLRTRWDWKTKNSFVANEIIKLALILSFIWLIWNRWNLVTLHELHFDVSQLTVFWNYFNEFSYVLFNQTRNNSKMHFIESIIEFKFIYWFFPNSLLNIVSEYLKCVEHFNPVI